VIFATPSSKSTEASPFDGQALELVDGAADRGRDRQRELCELAVELAVIEREPAGGDADFARRTQLERL
jgi:hypothetical protein